MRNRHWDPEAEEFWKDSGDRWRDALGIVHARLSGFLTMACGMNQQMQRELGMSRKQCKWVRVENDAQVTCLGCVGQVGGS